MKKALAALILSLFIPFICHGAGSVTQSLNRSAANMIELTFTCIGDSANGSIPNTDITSTIFNDVRGMYIYRIVVTNTTSQTDTDNDCDVYIRDSNSNDVIGGDGVDQLDADASNYIVPTNIEPISNTLTLDVDNQSQASAEYTVMLICIRR